MEVGAQMKLEDLYAPAQLDGLVRGVKKMLVSVPLTHAKTMLNVWTCSWITFVFVPKVSMARGVRLHLKGALDLLA